MNKAFFLDRDGTINKDVGYVYKAEDFEFLPGVIEAIKILNEHNYLVIVITNQSGVARGYYTEEDVVRLHEHMNDILIKNGAHVDDFYYCPHHFENGMGIYKMECECRKPKPGMIEKAIIAHNIDRKESYMIGDNESDVLTGIAANLKGSFRVDEQNNLLSLVKKIAGEGDIL